MTTMMTPTVPTIIRTGHGAGNYHVVSITTVDRPWLRDNTLPVVATGFRIVTTGRYQTQGAAVREFNRLVRGDDDFASEFVSSVYVETATGHRRTVRRRVERQRARDLSTRELRVQALACHAYRIGNTFRFLTAEWDLEATWDDDSAELLAAA